MATPPFTLSNAISPITTPTYDGSGQVVHPDILKFGGGYKGGLTEPYTHIMAITPYPSGNDTYENPSVLVSNTPESAFTEDNIVNPIEPHPGTNQHNADADIVYNGGVFYLYWRYRNKTTGDIKIYRKKSTDLVSWTGKELTNDQGISPAFIYDEHEGKWKMWSVTSDYRVAYFESSDGLNWTLVGYTDIPQYIYYNGANRNCWHIDVNKTWLGRKYYALIVYASGAGGAIPSYLFFGESSDGLHWTVYDKPVLSPIAGTWQSTHIYRSTFIIEDGKIKVWYSTCSDTGVWRAGYTEASIGFVDLQDVTLNVVDVRPTVQISPEIF